MNTQVRTAFMSFVLAGFAAAQAVPATVEANARRIETELAKFGMKFDTPVPIEALGPGEFAAACQAELERMYSIARRVRRITSLS